MNRPKYFSIIALAFMTIFLLAPAQVSASVMPDKVEGYSGKLDPSNSSKSGSAVISKINDCPAIGCPADVVGGVFVLASQLLESACDLITYPTRS